jgi:hypothetical protein
MTFEEFRTAGFCIECPCRFEDGCGCYATIQEATAKLTAERTYYRDMWLAQRVENENYRKQLGLVAVSDEAERELTPRSTTPTDAHSKE